MIQQELNEENKEIRNKAYDLYEKHGFKVEGRYREAIFRDGCYHDYIIMSFLEEEYRNVRL